MTVAAAALALLFDVADFAAGGHFAISADHTSTTESGEAEKPNETHDALHRSRGAICVPQIAFSVRARPIRDIGNAGGRTQSISELF
jgi:hypothetical protein